MLKNYFKIAYRYLWKNKTSSFISITGLAIGMACCMLILLNVKDELSFNKFNAQIRNIYRINWISKDNSGTSVSSLTPIPFSKGLSQKIPGIQSVAKLYQRSGQMAAVTNATAGTASEKRFQEQRVYFTEQALFSIFSIPFIKGDRKNALVAPGSIVITDEMANKYFGRTDPVGKSLFYDNKTLLQVTGVVKKMPDNSDIRFDFLVSFETVYGVEGQPFADFMKN